MATSNSYDWNLNRDELILMAFQESNIYGVHDTSVNSNDSSFAVKKLNGMLKMWSIDGIKPPKRKIGYVFTALLDHDYKLGSISGSDHSTNTYVKTTLSADEASGQTILSITDTTGMTAADNIGIELDDGTRQWTTIATVDSGTQVTVDDSLTSAAASGNTVVTYTTKINRPVDIIYGTTVDLSSSNLTEVEMENVGHDIYLKTPVKNTTGLPNQFYYDKQISGARPHNNTLYVFPEPSDVNKILKIVYTDYLQDLDSASDDIDLPQEWLYPVMWNLAAELAYSYGKFTELEKIQPKAESMYQLLKDASADHEDIIFKIKSSRY